MATFGGVLNSALNNRMTPWHRGYGYSIAAVIKFPHRTRTRVTRFGNTVGISVPVLNPNGVSWDAKTKTILTPCYPFWKHCMC